MPRGLVFVGLGGAAIWWAFGAWLYWGFGTQHDAATYTMWAQWWIDGEVTELARNWPGTLIRPYLYHAFLGTLGFFAPGLLTSPYTRLVVSAVQVATFAAVVFRLAQATSEFGMGLARATVIGLLCAPFAVLTNDEVLSESISLSIVGMVVALAIPSGCGRHARFGNVVGVLAGLAALGMTRTAHLPVVGGAAIAIVAILAYHAVGMGMCTAAMARRLVFAGVVAWVLVLAPQASLMWSHSRLHPGDPSLWGEGATRLHWSQKVGKYATVVAACPGVPVAGVAYPLPFADGIAATGRLDWFLDHPDVAFWHLFQALNWDFPTTYVSTFNPLVTVPLNAVSLLVAVIGFMTVAPVTRVAVPRLAREAPVLVVVLAAIAGLWLQTAFTGVETRFGIIPWSALSVAAAWGAVRWWELVRRGEIRWWLAGLAVAGSGAGLVLSRLAVANVPAFQQLEAAGCWR